MLSSMFEQVGSIIIILGPMFSSKTTSLIHLCQKWQSISDNILCINHSTDNRYGDKEDNTYLYSHDLLKVNCQQASILSDIDIELVKKADIILINEGQFFADLIDVCILWSETYHKKIVVCGLDGDFERKPFGKLLELIPLCDSVEKLTALCPLCKDGTQALFTCRLTNEKDQIVIGSDNYMALCKKHYCEKSKV